MAQLRIGALRVSLGLDSAAFEAGTHKAKKSAKGLGDHLKGALGVAADTAKVALAGLTVAIGASIRSMDSMAKHADKVGLAVEDLQRLRHAADLSGVSTQTLDMAMQRFSRRVGEAAQGTGELKSTLEQYGIQIKNADGSMRSQVDILRDLANVIQGTTSAQERLRIANKAFDSEGAALVNTLKDGADGLNAMMREADELGIVFDRNTAANAEKFSDNLTRLRKILGGLVTQITADLLPYLAQFSDWVVANGPQIRAFAAGAIAFLAEGIGNVANRIRDLIKMFDSMLARLNVANASDGARLTVLSERYQEQYRALEKAQERARKIESEMTGDIRDQIAFRKTNLDLANQEAAAARAKLAATDLEIQSIQAAMRARQGAANDLPDAAPSGGGVVLTDLGAAKPKNGISDAARRRQEELEDARRVVAEHLEMHRRATTTQLEQLAYARDKQLEQLKDLFDRQLIDKEAYEKAELAITETYAVERAEIIARENERAAKQTTKLVAESGRSIIDEMRPVFSELGGIFDGLTRGLKSWERVALASIAKVLAALAAQGTFGRGGFLQILGQAATGIFGGFRANGGPVMSGRAYMVGERGPEMFVPGQAGQIVANEALGAQSGVSLSYAPVIDARGADAAAVTRLERIVAEQARVFTRQVEGVMTRQGLAG